MRKHNIAMSSAEIAHLWMKYQGETMLSCFLKHFLHTVEDVEVKDCLEYAFQINQEKIQKITSLYESEQHVIPVGFSDRDLNLNAPRLFTDVFYLFYIKNYTRFALKGNGMALGLSTRKDIIDLLTDFLQKTASLNNKVTETMLSKGVYIKPPLISIPTEIEYVESNNYFMDFLGKHRTLAATEITNLYGNIQSNVTGKYLLLGLSQVADKKEVRDYLVRLSALADKHINVLTEFLKRDMVPCPMPWDNFVTNSTTSPFSDKIMMFICTFINTIGLGDYGDALASNSRIDLVRDYSRFIAETLKANDDGVNIMIKNHWMEQPPKSDDRDAIINR